jgi:hypothetical protein
MKIFLNNALLHPLRALTIAMRKVLMNRDMADPLWDGGALPPQLERFTPGEALPWKGVQFKVGKVVGGDFPCVILVPVGLTKGAKLQAMRNFRDVARRVRDDRQAVAAAMQAQAPK